MHKIIVSILVLFTCHANHAQHLVNLSHLDKLYTTVKTKDKQVGAVWIYCEAPDYRLVADDDEGFTCVDDVARSLIVYAKEYKKNKTVQLAEKITALTDFLLQMSNGDGLWYNFMFSDGSINTDHINSKASPNFWTWRAYWALSEVEMLDLPDWEQRRSVIDELCSKTEYIIDTLITKNQGFEKLYDIPLPKLFSNPGADQLSVIILGLCNRYESHKNSSVLRLIKSSADPLAAGVMGDRDMAPYGAILCWSYHWHAWGSAQQLALLRAYEVTRLPNYLNQSLASINHFYAWLESNQYPSAMKLSKIDGNYIWISIDFYPQIAYGFSPLIMAASLAYRLTGDLYYGSLALNIAAWFYGDNKPNAKMYSIETGMCFDGVVSSKEVNKNAGAESTIEALLAMQAIEEIKHIGPAYEKFYSKMNNGSYGRN